jgi:adenosylcobinamide-phosphate synthase
MIWTGGMVMTGMLIDAGTGVAPKGWPRVPRPALLVHPAARALARLPEGWGGGALAAAAVLLGVAIAYSPGAPVWKVLLIAWVLEHRRGIDTLRAIANMSRESGAEMREAAVPLVGDAAAGMDKGTLIATAFDRAAARFADHIVAPVFWFCLAGLPGMFLNVTVTLARETPVCGSLGTLDRILRWVPDRLAGVLLALAALKPRAAGEAAAGAPAVFRRVMDTPDNPAIKAIPPAIGLIWRAWSIVFGLAFVVWVSF